MTGRSRASQQGQSGSRSVMADLTQILQAVEEGEEQSSQRLLPLVYEELRRLAAARMALEPENQTLQPTALVHEAWLRLVAPGEVHLENRRHFFCIASAAAGKKC